MDSGPPTPRRGSLSWWLTLRRRRCAGAEPPADICAQIEEPRAHSRRRSRHGASRSSTCAHLPISRADRQACARARLTSPHWRLVHHPTERQPLGRSGDRFLRTGRHPAGPPQWGPAAPGDRHPRRRGDAMPSKKQKTNGKTASTAPMRFTGDGASGTDEPRRRCATQDVHRRLLSMVPGYAEARDAIENTTLARTLAPSRFTGTARIPVVVHVVSNTAEQDISDEQVVSQIDVLNRDFRATNPDISAVPAVVRRAHRRRRGSSSSSRPRTPTATRPQGSPATATSVQSFGSDDRDQVGGDRRRRRVARRPVPQHVGVPARAAACWATPSSPAARPRPTAWSSPPRPSARPGRHGPAVRPRPHRDARGRPLPEPVPHLGRRRDRLPRQRPRRRHAQPGPDRTLGGRRSRTSAAATARTATCS